MNCSFLVRNTPYIVQFLYYGTLFSSVSEATITASGTLYMQGKTSSNRTIHFLNTSFAHNGTDITFSIFEGSTFTANGTTVIPSINQNRLSAKTSEFVTYSDPPNPTVEGTLLTKDRIFGSSGGVGQSVSAAALNIPNIEIIFKKNTDYALKVVNNTAVDTKFIVHWTWFESGN